MEIPNKDNELVQLPQGLTDVFDFSTGFIRVENLSPLQMEYAHLIAPEFFQAGVNPFRNEDSNYSYTTDLELNEELFMLHLFMDPKVLEQGNVRRFPAGVNQKYIREKYFEDRWVSEGNDALSAQLEAYVLNNLDALSAQEEIHMLDVGPCGGSITTLFMLRAFEKFGLLDKVQISMLDIVPNVLEATITGEFGERYKAILSQGKMHGVSE